MPDLNKMSLEEVLAYCTDAEHKHLVWLTNLFIGNEGFTNACMILAQNGRI